MIPDKIATSTIKTALGKMKTLRRSRLSIWDLDDTLFRTEAKHLKIKVVDRIDQRKPIIRNGKPLTVSSHDFANEKKLNELLDEVKGCLAEPQSFLSFRSASIFKKHSKAIEENVAKAVEDLSHKDKFFMILTARAKTNNKEVFLQHLADNGLNIKDGDAKLRSHAIFTRSVTSTPGAKGKQEVIAAILRNCPFIEQVDFWDDSSSNIASFNALDKEFPSIKFIPHHIKT